MKRLNCILLSLLFFSLSACSFPLPKQSFEPAKNFNAAVEGRHGDFAFAGTLSVNSPQDITLCFSSPAGIEGFQITLGEDGFYADVLGVTDFTPSEQLPDDSLVKLMLLSIRQAVFNQREFIKQGKNENIASFSQCGKQVSVLYDENGALSQLESKEAMFICYLKNTGI